MGKASQAKKAAREARESGRLPEKPKRKLGYPLIVAAAVVVGAVAVWFASRPADEPTANITPPEIQTPGSSVVTPDPTATTIVVGGTDPVPSSTTVAP